MWTGYGNLPKYKRFKVPHQTSGSFKGKLFGGYRTARKAAVHQQEAFTQSCSINCSWKDKAHRWRTHCISILPRLNSNWNRFKGTSDSVDENTTEDSDIYVGAQVNMPMDGELSSATIIRQARSSIGRAIRTDKQIKIIDTRSNFVGFPAGWEYSLTANFLTQSMYS